MFYVNTENSKEEFIELKRDIYFVDKTGIISAVVPYIGVPRKYICITRPRRFGKTTNARTVACFLSRGLEAQELFEGLEVTRDAQAMQHLGAHDVVYIDFSSLPMPCDSYTDYICAITNGIISDLRKLFPEANITQDERDLFYSLQSVYNKTKTKFCFVMDEWDSMFFNSKFSEADQREFLMFLKQLLKGRAYVDFAYMTGILPISKHSTGSELNMFTEYSAVDDPKFEHFFGFTEAEVRQLCVLHKSRKSNPRVTYSVLRHWYDGYIAEDGAHMFNPRSVVLALNDDKARSFWTESGPYDEIYYYVKHNIAAVREDVVKMVAGESVSAKPKNYAASAMHLDTRDEILSAMTVYGFLTYHEGRVSIPNYELMLKFQDVLEKEDMGYVAKLALRSEEMLKATLRGDTEEMQDVLEAAHDQEAPLLRYKNEADLAALVNLVYLAARDHYIVQREQPAGRGVADISFSPKVPASADYPPFIVELKAGIGAAEAIEQIRTKNYTAIFKDSLIDEDYFAATPLAVGISWDPDTKAHECLVEEIII